MFYTSNYGEPAGQQCNPPCTCGHNGTSCLQCPNDQQCYAKPKAALSTFMRWSNSTDGPWSTPLLVPAPTTGDTNCACVIRNNGSLVCMGRPGLGMFRAAHWRDIESYTPWSVPGGTHIVGEDPVSTHVATVSHPSWSVACSVPYAAARLAGNTLLFTDSWHSVIFSISPYRSFVLSILTVSPLWSIFQTFFTLRCCGRITTEFCAVSPTAAAGAIPLALPTGLQMAGRLTKFCVTLAGRCALLDPQRCSVGLAKKPTLSLPRSYTWSGTKNKAYQNVVEIVGAGPKILSRRERPHVVLDKAGIPIALTNGVTEAWPCTLQREPDRPPCKHPAVPGKNPDCGPGSNGTSIWCPVDYCYTLYQPLNNRQ